MDQVTYSAAPPAMFETILTIDFYFNRDGMLRRREFRKFRKSVKRLARNKVCARHFSIYCDMKSDGKMTKREWTSCLGLDTNSKLIDNQSSDLAFAESNN